jgi:outer membrane protein assembly factor BamE (lipoprotein component of BamABCDE complex)
MKMTVLKILGLLILVGISGLIALHVYLLDGLHGWFFSSGEGPFEEDTVYAPGYSDKAFRRVKRGMSEQEVLNILGSPLGESWCYEKTEHERFRIWFADERISYVYIYHSDTDSPQVHEGMEKTRVLKMLGNPTKKSWVYSESPGDKSYRVRVILFKDDNVTKKKHYFYLD